MLMMLSVREMSLLSRTTGHHSAHSHASDGTATQLGGRERRDKGKGQPQFASKAPAGNTRCISEFVLKNLTSVVQGAVPTGIHID